MQRVFQGWLIVNLPLPGIQQDESNKTFSLGNRALATFGVCLVHEINAMTTCFQVFKNRRQLSAHEAAVHLKEKPFGCELCPYRASRKQHIKVKQICFSQFLQGEVLSTENIRDTLSAQASQTTIFPLTVPHGDPQEAATAARRGGQDQVPSVRLQP